MRPLPLYVAVAISGASVLALEILGTRVLGPFYGNSLFLWSALITVTLAALAIGYAVGGRWADKGATAARLGTGDSSAFPSVLTHKSMDHSGRTEYIQPHGEQDAGSAAARWRSSDS